MKNAILSSLLALWLVASFGLWLLGLGFSGDWVPPINFGTVIGILTGALQGYFGGKTDLAMQRFIEIWGAMPELYLLIIFCFTMNAPRS